MFSRNHLILLIACISVFFEALDIAIINLAMPLVQAEFHLRADTVQWLQTIYVLLYGGFLVLGGKLSDTVGKKRIFIAGSSLFLCTSLGAGLSSAFSALLICRALQGIAAALLMPSALSLVTTTFTEPKKRSQAVGIFSAFAAIGSGSGLSVGGLVATFLGWQWIFFINVPVICLTLILAYLYIQEENRTSHPFPDLLSGILLTGSISAISYLIHTLPESTSNLFPTLLLTAGIVLCIWLFQQRSKSVENPLIDFPLHSRSATGIGVTFLLGAFFTSYLFLISLVLQNNLAYSAAKAGLILFPFSILSALAGKMLIPSLLKRLSLLQTAMIGMAFMAIGALLLMHFLHEKTDLFWLLLSVGCVNGLGIAISFTTLTVLALQPVAEQHHGLVSSVTTTAYFFGGGIGLSSLSLLMHSIHGQESFKVDSSYLVLLILYALAGVGWLLLYSYKVRKTFNTSLKTV